MDDRPIGVFDSGVGGLTVLKEIVSLMPHEEIYYFGDTKRAPYGNLQKETLARYAEEITAHLTRQNVKAVVVACGTISAVCPDVVRRASGLPVVGMIEPGVRAALGAAKRAVCLLATRAAVESGRHKQLLRERNPSLVFYARACPAFATLVEAGQGESEAAYEAARQALAPFAGKELDAVILGCTHYPLMENAIRQAAGGDVTIVNPAREAAASLHEVLRQNGAFRRQEDRPPARRVAVSGGAGSCGVFLKQLFGESLAAQIVVETVTL